MANAAKVKKRLKDIAEIRVGYQFRGKVEPDPAGTVRVIQIRDIDSNCRIRGEDLVTVKLDRQEAGFSQQGDVLFLARGNRQFATLVAEGLENTIASGYFFIVRPKSGKVHPGYIAWWINQPEFQESLRPYVRGSNMRIVSKSDFRDMPILLPPLAVQEKIVTLNDLLSRESHLLMNLNAKRTALVHAVSRQRCPAAIRQNP